MLGCTRGWGKVIVTGNGQRVEAWISISEQMALYCELIDTNQIGRLPSEVLAPDASMGFGYEETWVGAEAVSERLQAIRDVFEATAHGFGNLRLDFDGETSANATSVVHGWHWVKANATGTPRNADYLAVALFQDRWVQLDGRWLLAHREGKSVGPEGQGFNAVGTLPDQFADIGT